MRRDFFLAVPFVALIFGLSAVRANCDEPENDVDLPLIIATEDDEPEAIEPEAPTEESVPAPAVVESDDLPSLELPESELTEEEMKRLSEQPLFKEFATTVDELAPLPENVDPEVLDAPGVSLFQNHLPQSVEVEAPSPEQTLESASQALDEVLEIASVDLESLNLSAKDRATIERLDEEIQRLCPLWIDAELNRAQIGRRELDWRQSSGVLYATNDPAPIDCEVNDWALAPDSFFFFQVVDPNSGETFYTKAGDFVTLEQSNLLSAGLVRGDRTYMLSIEPGKVAPTGNSYRVRILKNGQIQGVDMADRIVTDVWVGTIPLFVFDNPALLQSDDGVLFTPTPHSGQPQRVELGPGSKVGVRQHKLLPSNGKPEEIFARIVVLCKSKKRLVEILTQPRLK